MDTDLKNKARSVTLITREEIEASSAITVDELLRSVVGTEVWKPHGEFGPASDVRLRGFANSRSTVFLKDGMPINSLDCGQTAHNEIPLDRVERVEVVHGAAGSVQGKSGMGGVINIVTRKGNDDFSCHAGTTFGTYDTWTVNAGADGKIADGYNLRIGYSAFASDGYFAWADSWIKDRVKAMDQNLISWNNPDEEWSVKDNYLASLEKQTREMDTVTADLSGKINDLFQFNASYTWWSNDNDIGYKFGYINQERNRFGLNFKHKGKLDIKGNLFMLDQDVEFSQPVLPSPGMDEDQGKDTWLVQGHKNDIPLTDYGGTVSFGFQAGANNKITLSTDYRYGDLENKLYDGLSRETISINQATQYKWGGTIEDTLTLKKITTNVGVRYAAVKTDDFFYENRFNYVPFDYSSLEDDQLNPWLGVTWQPDSATKIRTGISRSSTFAPLSYLLGDYQRPPGKTIIGNPRLSTEYSYNYEMGVERNFNDKFIVSLTCYYNDIRDWMQEVSAADPAYSSISVRWENIEKAETKGGELEAELFLSNDLRLYGNYTLNFSKIKEFKDKLHNYNNKQLEGNTFPNQAKHKANLGMEWSDPRWARINLSFRYSGSRYYDIENTVKLDEYLTCDLKITRKINKYLTCSLEAKDLFDKAWQETEMHNTPGRTVFAKVMFKY
jgi:outer membrane cobalamin receptor